MAITIKPALRKNPQDKAAAAKYYAQVVLAPEMKQKQIVDQIADRCTLTGSDIKAVLDALMVVIKRNLANGSPVRLEISVHSILPFPVKAPRMPASVEQAV